MGLEADDPRLRAVLYKMFREFFGRAERRRRWSVDEDIPWDKTNKNLAPEIADVVESFCAVELYLPDYISKALPLIRRNRGWSWMHANWGYEELKHSLALGDWLLKSGHRTEEQMADLETRLYEYEWNLPTDSAHGMLIYAMVQERATWLHYRNLRVQLKDHGEDPALATLLKLIATDEMSHHAIYSDITKVFLEIDRPATLRELKGILLNFSMPAVHLLPDSAQRASRVRALHIFDEEIFYKDVFQPILEELQVQRREFKTV